MTKLAKLDRYDYELFPHMIRIKLMRTNDPILVDIMSDVRNCNGQIYVEGYYYMFLDRYQIVKLDNDYYLELHVKQN